MIKSHEILLSIRYLRSKRREAFVSVIAGFSFLGIMLGVATLIVVMSVMNGFRSELQEKILGFNGHLLVRSLDGNIQDYAPIVDAIKSVEGVEKAIPFVEGQVLASGPVTSFGVLVRGLRPKDFEGFAGIKDSVKAGDIEQFGLADGAVAGNELLFKGGLSVGDEISLLSPNGPYTPFGQMPIRRAYPVLASYEIGMIEYDRSVVFLPLSDAQEFLDSPGAIMGIEVFTNDPENIEQITEKIQEITPNYLLFRDWKQQNSVFFSALEVERNVMFLILTLIILVAALNIISGMTMLVKDKGRDIAILRTMGAARSSILKIFLLTGAFVGTSGTFVGLILGVVVARNVESLRTFISWMTGTPIFSPEIYYLSQLPSEIDNFEVCFIVLIALFLSLLATLYPAWKAAKLDPVQALRYE